MYNSSCKVCVCVCWDQKTLCCKSSWRNVFPCCGWPDIGYFLFLLLLRPLPLLLPYASLYSRIYVSVCIAMYLVFYMLHFSQIPLCASFSSFLLLLHSLLHVNFFSKLNSETQFLFLLSFSFYFF